VGVTVNKSHTGLRLFLSNDVYFYAVDNRPLWYLGINDVAISDVLNDVILKNEEIATFLIENPTVETKAGGVFKSKHGGVITRVVVSNSSPGSSGSTVVDVNIGGTTVFTEQAHRPVLAFDDADGVTEVDSIDSPAVAANGLISIDIDQLQTGTVRWLRVDVFIRRNIIVREADDYEIQSNEIVLGG